MFGTYRLILAFMVVFLHLAGWPGFGEYAVFTFFCLSGYLMTFIMQQNYGYGRQGVKKYAFARMLRIYPLYIAACLMSVVTLIIIGEEATSAVIFNLRWPEGIINTLSNLTLMNFDHKSPALVPPSWALTVEIIYYALIGLGLSKTKTRTWLWFGAGVMYTVAIFATNLPWWDYGYFHPAAASLPFATGALMYHYKDEIGRTIGRFARLDVAILLYGFVLLNWYWQYKNGSGLSIGFYINFLINCLLLAVLTHVKVKNKRLLSFDKKMGDLSYPIYLIHWTVGVLVFYGSAQLGFELTKRTEMFAIVSIPFMLLFGQLTVMSIHKPVETLRDWIKRN